MTTKPTFRDLEKTILDFVEKASKNASKNLDISHVIISENLYSSLTGEPSIFYPDSIFNMEKLNDSDFVIVYLDEN